ncbi:hypothetical protein ABK905_14030 [Acerihabitans sp. KWT182]|uniref:Uncharacterized protein n=1 Tax=Acerihabitans sp. KWT182 TaxID=3157919 RepID=A0AAU7Q700_9GAMM
MKKSLAGMSGLTALLLFVLSPAEALRLQHGMSSFDIDPVTLAISDGNVPVNLPQSPPAASVTFAPHRFAPTGDGRNATCTSPRLWKMATCA